MRADTESGTGNPAKSSKAHANTLNMLLFSFSFAPLSLCYNVNVLFYPSAFGHQFLLTSLLSTFSTTNLPGPLYYSSYKFVLLIVLQCVSSIAGVYHEIK